MKDLSCKVVVIKHPMPVPPIFKVPRTGLSNLWAPIEIDYGARGAFSDIATKRSLFAWIDMHRAFAGVTALLCVTFAFNNKGRIRGLPLFH